MEAIITSGSEDPLIEGLSFRPPSNTANYVLETRQVTYQAESGNGFDPVSRRVIRFRLADHGFLEAPSVKLALTLQNKGDQTITPIGQLMSLFRRARAALRSKPAHRGSNRTGDRIKHHRATQRRGSPYQRQHRTTPRSGLQQRPKRNNWCQQGSQAHCAHAIRRVEPEQVDPFALSFGWSHSRIRIGRC